MFEGHSGTREHTDSATQATPGTVTMPESPAVVDTRMPARALPRLGGAT